MTVEALHNALRAEVAANLPDNIGTVVYDNQDLASVPGSGRYARVRILGHDHEQVTCGATARFRARGRVVIEVFEPLGQGDRTLLENIDTLRTAFLGHRVASPQIAFDPPSVTDGTRAGAFYMRSLVIPFRADELVTT